MKLWTLALSLAAALFFHAVPAPAATIGATYTGVVTDIGGTVSPGPFSAGDTVTFNVRLDTAGSVVESHPDAALYDAVLHFSGKFSNGYEFTVNTGVTPGVNGVWVRQWNVSHSVTIGANAVSGSPVSGVLDPSLYIHFEDLTATMLNSTAVPSDIAGLFSLSQERYFQLYFMGAGSDEFFVNGSITSAVAVAQTPIPAALPLFASALGGLGFFGWKRRRTAGNAEQASPTLS